MNKLLLFLQSRRISWGLMLVGVLGILTGLGLFTFSYAKGTSYLSDDPQTCMICHVMRDQFEAWQRSSHARVATCNDCHTPHSFPDKWVVKAMNGWNHSVAFTLNNFHEPIRITSYNAQVALDNCVYCHQTLVSHILDGFSDESMQCTACHGSIGHRTRD